MYAWVTEDEVRFIRSIGRHSNTDREDPVERHLRLLRLYRDSLKNRAVWKEGAVCLDEKIVRGCVIEELARASGMIE
jgi:hypothetical protein